MINKLLPAFGLIVVLLLMGCSSEQTAPTNAPTATLIAYTPATPTPTWEVVDPTVTIVPSVGPSPTPFVHVVQQDDTLLGIALRYGLTLEEILAANPDINPRILSIDQEILIPSLEGEIPGGLIPTATPLALELAKVHCYPTATDHSWCITYVSNESEEWMEGLSAMITIFNREGDQLDSKPAYAPLNLLPPGFVMPLGVKFSQPVDLAIATTNSSFHAERVEDRYVSLNVEWEIDAAQSSDHFVHVRGEIEVSPDNEFGFEDLSLLVTAMDEAGRVAGYRKWKRHGRVEVGESIGFEIEVFSLGPSISRVEVMAEAFQFIPEE